MNAVSSITPASDAKASTGGAVIDPHRFRSQLIDNMAKIEAWAVGRLRAANEKIPPGLGQRLERVLALTQSHPWLYPDARSTKDLLAELKPYQELRSKLAHSVARTGRSSGRKHYIFNEAVAVAGQEWRSRITLDERELPVIGHRVAELSQLLSAQVLP